MRALLSHLSTTSPRQSSRTCARQTIETGRDVSHQAARRAICSTNCSSSRKSRAQICRSMPRVSLVCSWTERISCSVSLPVPCGDSSASRINASVIFIMAETTTTGLRARECLTTEATCEIAPAFPTDVPPNFITIMHEAYTVPLARESACAAAAPVKERRCVVFIDA